MRQILMVGNGPPLNRGCEAIVLGTRKILERSAPGVRLVNLFIGSWREANSRLPSRAGASVEDRCLCRTPAPWSPRYWLVKASQKGGGMGSEHILPELRHAAFAQQVADSALALRHSDASSTTLADQYGSVYVFVLC